MRRNSLCLLCLAMIASCFFRGSDLSAQSPGGVQAGQVLNSSIAVVVPSGVSVHDVLMKGTVEFIAGATDETGSITLQAITDGSSKVDISLPSRTTNESVVLSGKRLAGQKRDEQGRIHSAAPHNLLTDSAWFCPALLLQHFAFYSTVGDVSYVGVTEKRGLTVDHLSSSRHLSTGSTVGDKEIQRLSKMDIFIDPNSRQPTELHYLTHPEGNSRVDIPVEVRYSDYQPFDGVLMPTHLERYVNGVLALDIHLTSITLNSGLTGAQLQLQ